MNVFQILLLNPVVLKPFHVKDPPTADQMNLKNIYSKICTNVKVFSKIADLQARISAIFQWLKSIQNSG